VTWNSPDVLGIRGPSATQTAPDARFIVNMNAGVLALCQAFQSPMPLRAYNTTLKSYLDHKTRVESGRTDRDAPSRAYQKLGFQKYCSQNPKPGVN
jgi:hypothetical protein